MIRISRVIKRKGVTVAKNYDLIMPYELMESVGIDPEKRYVVGIEEGEKDTFYVLEDENGVKVRIMGLNIRKAFILVSAIKKVSLSAKPPFELDVSSYEKGIDKGIKCKLR